MKPLSIASASLMVCATVIALSACSNSTESPSTPSTGASTTAMPTSGVVSAEALCDFLRGEQPKLQAAGGELAAMTKLTVEIFNWYDKQGAVPNGVDIDRLTLEKCPDVRTQVLKSAGIENFSAL